eukprot:649808-Pleurochrysis_carterae.AAC.2
MSTIRWSCSDSGKSLITVAFSGGSSFAIATCGASVTVGAAACGGFSPTTGVLVNPGGADGNTLYCTVADAITARAAACGACGACGAAACGGAFA